MESFSEKLDGRVNSDRKSVLKVTYIITDPEESHQWMFSWGKDSSEIR